MEDRTPASEPPPEVVEKMRAEALRAWFGGSLALKGITIPILGILSCLYLMYFLPSTSWFRFAAWLNLGFVIYIAYGAVQSRRWSCEAR